MSKPLRDYGTDPLDTIRRTLSLQLRAVLYDEGLVSSPELPLRPIPADDFVVANDTQALPTPLATGNPTRKEIA